MVIQSNIDRHDLPKPIRYVVKFDDGKEELFFQFEIVSTLTGLILRSFTIPMLRSCERARDDC